MTSNRISKYNKEIYNWSDDLRIYKDGFSFCSGLFNRYDIKSIDVLDEYIIIIHAYMNNDRIMIYFKSSGGHSKGLCLHRYMIFMYSDKLHECYENCNGSMDVYIYNDISKKYEKYSVGSWDPFGLMSVLYKKDVNVYDIIEPKRVYSNDWLTLKISRSRDSLNDISVICSV